MPKNNSDHPKTGISRRTLGLGALGAVAAGGLTLGAPRRARAAGPIIIKFSHVVANDTPKGKGALRFKELAEKYTGGKVSVEVYPNSQLYKDKEEIEALQLGAVQVLAPSTAKFAPLGAKEFEALDLPFIFPNQQVYEKVTSGPLGKELMSKLEPKGIKGLAFWDNGYYMVSATRPLRKPSDFQGLKFRISGSKVADRYFRVLGAIPQIIAFSETYQALQTGVVDGCENTASNYYTQKFYEVQPHITQAHHGHLQYAVIVNSKFWSGLPADIRTQLDKAMAEATTYTNSIALQENEDSLKKIIASGKTSVYTLTPEEQKAWMAVMLPVHKWAEGRVGKEIIDKLHKEAGFKA